MLFSWLRNICSHFESYLGFGLIQVNEIYHGTKIHVVCPIQPILAVCPKVARASAGMVLTPKPEYSVSSISRVKGKKCLPPAKLISEVISEIWLFSKFHFENPRSRSWVSARVKVTQSKHHAVDSYHFHFKSNRTSIVETQLPVF